MARNASAVNASTVNAFAVLSTGFHHMIPRLLLVCLAASRRFVVILGLFLVMAEPAFAHADAVDEFVEAQRKWLHIPGISLAVVKNGRVVKARGYGLANVELEFPAGADT